MEMTNFFCNRMLLTFCVLLLIPYSMSKKSSAAGKNHTTSPPLKNRSFIIDYEHNTFLKDGKPFQFIAGSIHYFRMPRVYWRDRLRKLKAAGLHAVTTYVEWSTHEPWRREYSFEGDNDVEYFVQLAQEENLLVILRPGPYICAERDLGGFPAWLLMHYPNIKLRSSDTNYQAEVKSWFDVLLPKMNKYLYGNGGPIIMVQVENEYGSVACGIPTASKHKIWLRDLVKSHVKDAAVLFTTDGGADGYLKCGVIPDVYATVDFGAGGSGEAPFRDMRKYAKKGPLVNSEFYSGWLTHWEEEYQRGDTSSILHTMTEMWKQNASFNFYMFHGGTNFGFTNGANRDGHYSPQLTSYDYDAPLDEAGDPTPKYFAIRELIGKHFPLPNITVPKEAPRGSYGTIQLNYVVSLFNYQSIPDTKTVVDDRTKTFEELKLKYGYVLYQTKLPAGINSNSSILQVHDVRDRANVYVNQEPVAILSRKQKITSANLKASPKDKLSLLVENQGRFSNGNLNKDVKGLIEIPQIDDKTLHSWEMTTFPFTNVSWVPAMAKSSVKASGKTQPPAIYYGALILPPRDAPKNTFIDPTGWGKGIIFVNGHNLGRYWPAKGSQVTLFVPASYLRPAPQINHIVVMETDETPTTLKMRFTDKPSLQKVPPK